jgi:hypothetical protein
LILSRGIEEMSSFHEQCPGESVHMGDEIFHRRESFAIGDLGANVLRKGVGGDVVRGQKCAVDEVAQAHRVAGLKADSAHSSLRLCVGRDLGECGKVGFIEVCPVERYERRGDLCQAGNLDLGVLVFGIQNSPGLVVDDDVALGGL